LYQTGFDASWEPDFWGRIRRSVEAADAGIARQDALLDLTRLTLVSDVAKNYFSLRTTQAQIALMQQDIAALREIQSLTAARAQRGLLNHIDTERQQSELN
uniref:TolC family protein n=1 Tax=Staphylococcus aureus TaxID=1280 RepID=UPI00301DA834